MARFEKITYESASGERVVFGEAGLYINANDLRNYEWSYDSKNDTVSNLRRKVAKKKLPLVMVQNTEEAGIALKNKLYSLTERDVRLNTPGKIWCGDFYLSGFVVKAAVSKYSKTARAFKDDLTFVTSTNSGWIKEIKKNFVPESSAEQEGADYPYDYMYDYSNPLVSDNVYNSSIVPCDFQITIYGPCNEPVIYVGSHEYRVDVNLQNSEKLVIDSQNKVIKLVRRNGKEENAFMYRDTSSYIFRKIEPGVNKITVSEDFDFTITLYDERSQPEWT